MDANGNYRIARHCGEKAMPRKVGTARLFGLAVVLALSAAAPAWAHGTTERVSVGPGGVQSDLDSYYPSISADGRFITFDSDARNLVPGDTNSDGDVFVRDRKTGTTKRVSLGPGGVQGDVGSYYPSISADGRFVAFESDARNLVPGDNNGTYTYDVFVRDRQTGTTERVSVGPGGLQGDSDSYHPSISADGRFIAFESDATNLVPGDTNGDVDVFLRDRQTGTTKRVSVGPGGIQGDFGSYHPSISADGQFIAFVSDATNLVPGDTNGNGDVFVRDRQTGTTKRVSVGPGGLQVDEGGYNPSISADGRFIAFASYASNLVPGDTNDSADVFVRDRQTGTTERVSVGPGGVQGNSYSDSPSISADGRFVAFESDATNLVPGDTNEWPDVFVHDRKTGRTRRVSVGPGGVQGNSYSDFPAISADGRFVAFASEATNMVPGDTNGAADVFVRTLVP